MKLGGDVPPTMCFRILMSFEIEVCSRQRLLIDNISYKYRKMIRKSVSCFQDSRYLSQLPEAKNILGGMIILERLQTVCPFCPPSILSANDKYARVSVVRPLTRRFKIIHLHCINSTSYNSSMNSNSSIIFFTPIFSFNTNQIFHVTRLLLPLDFHSLVLNWFKAY